MLWLLGTVVLIIDIFNRLSVPLPHESKIDNGTEKPHTTTISSIETPLLLNEDGVSHLLERLHVSTLEEAHKSLNSPGDQVQVQAAVQFSMTKVDMANHTDHSEDEDENEQRTYSSILYSTHKQYMSDHLDMTTGRSATVGDDSTPHSDSERHLKKKMNRNFHQDPVQSESEGMYRGNVPEPRGANDANADHHNLKDGEHDDDKDEKSHGLIDHHDKNTGEH